jgi:hypothetical protein
MNIVIVYRDEGQNSYLPLIEMAFKSAKRIGYQTILITSNPNLQLADFNIIMPYEQEEFLMNWILAAQLAYINSGFFDVNSVLFSPDALIIKPLSDIFSKEFDVAFTDRDNKKYPINNGVIFLKPNNQPLLSNLWEQALLICKSYDLEIQKWFGDQLCLHDLLVKQIDKKLGVIVKLLPCETYNASPKILDYSFLTDVYIAHFKGKRKHLMKEYWSKINR